MNHIKNIFLISMLMLINVSAAQETINIKLSDIDENGNVTLNLKLNIEQAPVVVEPEPEDPPVIPEEPVEPSGLRPQVIYDEDLAVDSPQSTTNNPVFPRGLSEVFDITYDGSYRALTRGESNSHHVTGTLGLNKENNSIYMVGFSRDSAIAEFAIPDEFSFNPDASEVVNAQAIQTYVKVLDSSSNNVVTGMATINNKLWVNSEIRYDAGANSKKALQILDPNDLAGSDKAIFNRVIGDAKIAGYIGQIPEDAQPLFNNMKWFMGNTPNHSINGRYSQGPSFAPFNPEDLQGNVLTNLIAMVYPYTADGSTHITPKADDTADDNPSPLWNALSKAYYAFIPKDSKVLVVMGSNSGYNDGIIYKSDPRYPERTGDGPMPVNPDDMSNFYWLFDLNAIAQAEQPHLIQPFNYGKWSHPHDGNKANVGGGAFNIETGQLHISLKGAAKIELYDNPPMINVYTIKFRGNN